MTDSDLVRAWAAQPQPAVIFDFNGTLSDDEPILTRIFTELFAEHLGWSMTAEEYESTLLGHSDREIVEIAVSAHGGGDLNLIEDLLRLRKELYREAVAERSPISAEAVDLVEQLAAAGVPMAIVTGAQRDDVLAVLAASPVRAHLHHLVAEEDVRRGKPDPEGFLRGAELLGAEPSSVLVFEDSVPGLRGAEAAGMHCITVNGPATFAEVSELI